MPTSPIENAVSRTSALDILLADDEPSILDEVGGALRQRGHHVTTACDGAQVLAYLRSRAFDLVISDVRLPTVDGFAVLRRLRTDAPATDVVLMSGFASVPDAVAAMKEEAVDYLTKPFEIERLLMLVNGVTERRRLIQSSENARRGVDDDPELELVGHAPAMVRLRERLAAFASSDAPVLVLGESGTGKELAARMIHRLSSRRDRPFAALNCAAFPDTLIEAELFGHVRGAFTGAVRDRKGRLADADRGTLFLDEVAELSPPAQAKLLRVLQEGTFTPIGTNNTISVDIRVISATNQNLKKAISEGRFREDLFFRLKVLDANLPSLAERRGDLPLLVEHFLRRYTAPEKSPPRVAPRAWAALAQYRFPGNVRELEHAVQYALVLSRGEEIKIEHLPDDIRGEVPTHDLDDAGRALSLGLAVESFEREYIRRALVLARGNRGDAAKLLGVSRKHLWQKMRVYRITDADIPESDSRK